MRYKTIIHELLQDQYPVLHDRLRQQRTLMKALDRYAIDLKNAHVAWMNELRTGEPGAQPGPDRVRGTGAGDSALAGRFALRIRGKPNISTTRGKVIL